MENKDSKYSRSLIYNQIEELIISKRYSKAILICDSVLDINPKERLVHRLKAKAYYNSMNFSEAIPCYTNALGLIKEEDDPYLRYELLRDRAYSYKRVGEIDSAIKDYQESIVVSEPKFHSVSYYCLGKIYLERGDTSNACINLHMASDFYKAKTLLGLFCR